MNWDDPMRLHSARELTDWVREIGFLPLFRGEIPGFSAEEHTADGVWFTGDPEHDPWIWREEIARAGEIAYGKFFGGRAGFVSPEWFPALANYRRDGYDFDTLWEEGLARGRSKKLMDCLELHGPMMSTDLKSAAGFGKGGEKNFSGIVTELQMQTYLVVTDFRRKVSRAGAEYGMSISVLAAPETRWGYDAVTAAYAEEPAESLSRIREQIRREFCWADVEALDRLLK